MSRLVIAGGVSFMTLVVGYTMLLPTLHADELEERRLKMQQEANPSPTATTTTNKGAKGSMWKG